MTPRQVLAANLQRLMDASPGLSTLKAISQAGGGSHGTVDRIRRATNGTSVDNLAELAKVFGVEPWHLLMPTLQAHKSGHTQPGISGVPVWPFSSELLEAVNRLSPEETARLENVVRAYLGLATVSAKNHTEPQRRSAVEVMGSATSTPAMDRENNRHSQPDGNGNVNDGEIAGNRHRGKRRSS